MHEQKLHDGALLHVAHLATLSRAVVRLLRRPGAWPDAVADFLGELGEALRVSRVHLSENQQAEDRELHAVRRWEWIGRGGAPQIDDPELRQFAYHAAGLGSWIDRLGAGELLHGTVDELSDQEKSLPRRLGVRSLAIVPIFAGELWWGFLAVDEICAERRWSPTELATLELAAATLGKLITEADLESRLKGIQERYERLFEDADDFVFTHDRQGRFTSISRRGARLTGYDRDELLTMSAFDVVAPEDRQRARSMALRKLRGETEATNYEIDIVTKAGKRLRVELNTRVIIQNGEAVGVQGVARDVTERRRLEERLYRSQKMEAMGRLAGGIAHDFNNLLTVINGNSAQLAESLSAADPRRQEVHEIRQAGDQAALLTRQLLAFSRQQVMLPKLLDLNDVVAKTRGMLRRVIREDIDLRTDLAPELGTIRADPGQVEQVIMNLVINARDAMSQGGTMTLSTREERLAEDDGEAAFDVVPGPYVLLSVADTGVGMDDAVRERLFEPFFTTKELGQGTGLGLSTVYGIVKQCGGYIFVDSQPGQGSCFRVYFPRVDGQRPAAEAVSSQSKLAGNETVLVVEDDDMVRHLAQRILENRGYSVLAASEGRGALELCERTQHIDLLLTDVVLPGASGPDVARAVCSLHPEIRIIFMSGYTDRPFDQSGPLLEDTSFLQKPFSPDVLLSAVREVLDGASSPAQTKT